MKEKTNNQFIYFSLSDKYFNLVEAVLGELIKQENTNTVLSNKPISNSEFHEQTKWGDFNIAEPLLYNFYHGIELLLKGFLKPEEIDIQKKGHGLMSLFEIFKKKYPNHKMIVLILKKYINTNSKLVETLKVFFTNNNIDIAKYYEVLRYPENINATNLFSTEDLRYLDKEGMTFFSDLHSDVNKLKREMVKHWQSSKIKSLNSNISTKLK